ncbi:MAG TPA: ribonuclease PH [Candidatus Eisenbacteria bacterium]
MTRPPQAIRARSGQPEPPPATRPDGRTPRQARPFRIKRGVMPPAEGSALVSMGRTRVLCTATVEDRVPHWRRGKGQGWVTAEYGMLPRSTGERTPRTAQTGGRAQEIQRLIGRSLRAVTRLDAFGERTILLDCDVLEADGGTRTAAINGAMVALHDAFVTLSNRGHLAGPPFSDTVAAISVGVVAGVPCLDLAYVEDSQAQVDMNVVMTGSGRYVEVQGSAEGVTFTDPELRALLRLARAGIRRVVAAQRKLLAGSGLLP